MIQGPLLEAVVAATAEQGKPSSTLGSSSATAVQDGGGCLDIWEAAINSANKFIAAPPVDEQFELLFSVNMIVLNSSLLPGDSNFVLNGACVGAEESVDGLLSVSSSSSSSLVDSANAHTKLTSPPRAGNKVRFGRIKKLLAATGTATTTAAAELSAAGGGGGGATTPSPALSSSAPAAGNYFPGNFVSGGGGSGSGGLISNQNQNQSQSGSFILPSESMISVSGSIPSRHSTTELRMLLVVTNVTVYIVYFGSLPASATFLDAPVPMLFRAHPLHHLK